jgi:CheY-like chemotaxis protein
VAARVLLGDFGAIVRLGLLEVLEEGQLLVAEETPATQIIDRLVRSLPDAVVLDIDVPGTAELAMRISNRFPSVTIIACSSERPEMRIFPPFHHGESYVSELTSVSLIEAVGQRRA